MTQLLNNNNPTPCWLLELSPRLSAQDPVSVHLMLLSSAHGSQAALLGGEHTPSPYVRGHN